MPALGTCTGGQRQRQGPQHHRAGGHQDRPKAQRTGLGHGGQHIMALLAQLIAELDHQNTVLGDQSNQCDQPDLREHVERATRQLQGPQRTHHRQRHGQQDHKGINEALKLCRQHQKDEQ